jgi:hypothetical protein
MVSSHSAKRPNKPTRCLCGCPCSVTSHEYNEDGDSNTTLPVSTRPRTLPNLFQGYGDLFVASRPVPQSNGARLNADSTSVQGQEGVTDHYLEIEDDSTGPFLRSLSAPDLATSTNSVRSSPPTSLDVSMLVEPGSGEQSIVSSAILMPLTPSPSNFLGQMGGHFDMCDAEATPSELGDHFFIISPLRLSYEPQFCRNFGLGAQYLVATQRSSILDEENLEKTIRNR